MLSILMGLVFMSLGMLGLIAWWPQFISAAQGSFPALFIAGGFLAIIAGYSGIRDIMQRKKEDSTPSDETSDQPK